MSEVFLGQQVEYITSSEVIINDYKMSEYMMINTILRIE